jgi:integrase
VCRDLFAAFRLLIRRAKGDYGEDKHPQQFPKLERTADPGLTPWNLFERYVADRQPKESTVVRWRGVFLKLKADFPTHNAATLTREEVEDWLKGLITSDRSAGTVRASWLIAARTVFGFAVEQRLISQNPFTGIKIPVPRKNINREKTLTADEIKTILTASSATQPRTKLEAVKRWAPWLCAYSGARVGEITQLRGIDVVTQDGVPAIKITPEAGTQKTGRARTVPIHAHLIEQGFLDFVKSAGEGPLFYNPHKGTSDKTANDPTNPRKPRFVKAREELANWIRAIGVTDRGIQPNHAWRHTFKQIGYRSEISERLLDAIVGHTPMNVGRGYGTPSLQDMATALRKFPRYEI